MYPQLLERHHCLGAIKLIANNSRFLILPDWHLPNLGSKVLALSQRRLPAGRLAGALWPPLAAAGETFIDPQGFRRTAGGYSAQPQTPKQVFVRALHTHARAGSSTNRWPPKAKESLG